MAEVLLAKYGEIALKGLNKASFEDILLKNVKRRLRDVGEFTYRRAQSTLYIQPADPETDLDEAVRRLQHVFGLATVSRALAVGKTYEAMREAAVSYPADELMRAKTFKVDAKRSDKSFPMESPELMRLLGGEIAEAFPHLSVDVRNPEVTVTAEVRDFAAYIHAGKLPAAGGMPVGSSGKALLLLSGGLDSPVAGHMMAKRGVRLSAIHFVSPPYTSDMARIKVERLCERMSDYCGSIDFYCVPFTEIQETIKYKCPEEYFTIIMRRLMMKIAIAVAEQNGMQALITGESLAQVASQTIDALMCTDAVSTLPVFRPVIGMDKSEIIEIARRIGTYDISIEPYEDCCTVFTPKHPKTKPHLADVEAAEARFDFAPLITAAVEGTQRTYIG